MNYQFYCRKQKVSKKTGLCPIEVSVMYAGKRTFISLPRKINPKDLENPENVDYINAVRVRLIEYENKMLKEGIVLTPAAIKQFFKQGFVKKVFTVADVGQDYLDIIDARGDITKITKDRYHRTWDMFIEFTGLNPEMSASLITTAHIELYKTKLNEIMLPSSSCGFLKKIKSIFRFSFENGNIPSNPTYTLKINRGETDKVRFLQPLELERLRVVKLPKRLEQVRDCFIVSAGSGLSFSDLAGLKPEDFKVSDLNQLYVTGNRNKTGISYTAIFLDDAAEIVRKYNYRLPIISNQKTNAFLKEIAALADIETNLTFHVARHTFTYRLLNELELPEETIMKMCGWKNTSMVHYYARLMDSTIFKQVRRTQNRVILKKITGK